MYKGITGAKGVARMTKLKTVMVWLALRQRLLWRVTVFAMRAVRLAMLIGG